MNTQTEETQAMNSYERALAYAADQGITIPDEIKQQAESARIEIYHKEQQAVVARNAAKSRIQRVIDAYIERYPKLQDGVTKLGNWLMALIKLFTINIGATVIMFGVMVAEILRVRTGLAAIEASPLAVELLSVVLVFLLFFLEVAGFYIEREGNYNAPTRFRWSLRILIQDWKYALGIGKDWKEREISPATRMILTKWIIQFSVAFIALYGSMAHIIKGHSGNWGEALGDILSNSSLDEMSSWGIGLLLTIGILFGSAAMIWFVASRAKQLEDSDFAVGEDKIELLGWKRAGDVITTFTTDVTRERRERRKMTNQFPATPVNPTPATSTPAMLPRKTEGSIPIRQSDNQTTDRQTDKAKGNKAAIVRLHFQNNPSDLSVDVRTIATKLGVGKDTVNTVRKEFDRQTNS